MDRAVAADQPPPEAPTTPTDQSTPDLPVRAADDGAVADRSGRAERRLGLLLLVAACIVFVVHAGPTLGAAFGDSHDGRNAGVWAAGARSLIEEGPLTSRMGARSVENGTYADHPPLLYAETALAETLGGQSPVATRAPAWLGSLATLILVAVLLRDRGLRPFAVGLGVAAIVATQMFLVYGTMLDTFVSSVPFGVALLIAWLRARDRRPLHPALAFTLAVAAPLAGWQSLLVAAVVGGWALWSLARSDRPRRATLPLVLGTATGAALVLVWLLWALDGNLRVLLNQYQFRTGQGSISVGVGSFASGQLKDLTQTFGPALLIIALVGLGLALRDRRTRAVALATLAVTVPYTVAFRAGAFIHQYWNYWFILLVALGVAVCVDQVGGLLVSRGRDLGPATAVGMTLIGILIVGAWLTAPSATNGEAIAGDVAAAVRLPSSQSTAWYAGAVGDPPGWLALATHRQAVRVRAADALAFGRDHPNDLVFVGRGTCRGRELQLAYSWIKAPAVSALPRTVSSCS